MHIYAISIDTPDDSRNFLEKIAADGKGAVRFPLLSDPAQKVIDGYGLRDHQYDGQQFEGLPRPAIYLIDKKGRVAWAKVEDDYKKRPTIEELRSAVHALQNTT